LVNRVISSDAPPRPVFTQLQTYRCVAANRRFGPILLNKSGSNRVGATRS
jgi:hypothetical protein